MAPNVHEEESDDDFVLIQELPDRTKPKSPTSKPLAGNLEKGNSQPVKSPQVKFKHDVKLSLDKFDDGKVLLSITPPNQPKSRSRTGCDIVLVIDVSGSMAAAAELPDQAGNDVKESSGLSILDLVKHSCRAILSKLEEKDRLAIVTFSTSSTVVLPLTNMTDAAKQDADAKIEKLRPLDITNLWSGIREGLELFKNESPGENCQGLFVLTDGIPNYMCPAQGYVQKIKEMLPPIQTTTGSLPTISTFGFGYSLRSGLLRSIAEVGGGNYAFIPDAGMIGTVFVHAVANLFSAFARQVKITLRAPADVELELPAYLDFDTKKLTPESKELTIANLQYGQSRNIMIEVSGLAANQAIHADCVYSVSGKGGCLPILTCQSKTSEQPRMFLDYHLLRHEICNFLYAFSTKNQNGEYVPLGGKKAFKLAADALQFHELIAVHSKATKGSYGDDPFLPDMKAILCDVIPPDPDDPHNGGQIMIALTPTSSEPDSPAPPPFQRIGGNTSGNTSHYNRWGFHYLPSILHAHMRQMCLTFKDPGPLCYGKDSPLFCKLRTELDEAFDKLPPPTPSLKDVHHTRGHKSSGPVAMSRYRSARNPCFLGNCLVKTNEEQYKQVEELRAGEQVWTPRGLRSIQVIIVTDTKQNGGADIMDIISAEGRTLSITPWHPVFDNSTGAWMFPEDLVQQNNTNICLKRHCNEPVYSIVLSEDRDPDSHAIEVGGILCVTLGHGVVSGTVNHDARAHTFFGDHQRVTFSISKLDKDGYGRRLSGGISKVWNGDEFLADGFVQPALSREAPRSEVGLRARL